MVPIHRVHFASGDGAGHGPDIASDEWKSVIEFHLWIRGNAAVPDHSTSEWCDFIDSKVKERHK